MAYGDGTGPMGDGQMTGRGAGFCAGFTVPGYMNPAGRFCGRGMGRGMGRGGAGFGRGFRNVNSMGRQRFAAMQNSYTPQNFVNPATSKQDSENEKEYLKSEAEYLKKSLENITKRLEQLESAKTEQ